MKNIFENIDKAFENRVRLGIMSALMVNDEVDLNTFKELLGLTDGNLASHVKALEKINYIDVKKDFVGKKPRTTYVASVVGRNAFTKHLAALENLIKIDMQNTKK